MSCHADTVSEKAKFFEDAMRLAKDVSGNQTFHTVKPLLNFWAAFSPSNEVCAFFSYNAISGFTLTNSRVGSALGANPRSEHLF